MLAAGVMVGFFLFVTSGRAADAKEVERGIAAKKIVSNAITAMGGAAALNQIRNISMLGMTHVWVGTQEIQGSAKYTFLRPDKYRVDVDLPSAKITQAFNGKQGWGLENLKPYPPEISQRVASSMQIALMRGLLALLHFEQPQARWSVVAREDVEGGKADAVDFDDGAGNTTRFYFDVATHLPVRALYADIDAEGRPVVTLDVFFNFRKVGAVRWPHRIVEYQADQRKREDIFTEIRINEKVPESFFDPIGP